MLATVLVGIFGLVVGLWLTLGTTDSLIGSLTSDYVWHDEPSTLTFVLMYAVKVLRIVAGLALVVTGVLLFARIRIATFTAIVGGAFPLLAYAVWLVNNLQSMEERDELGDQLFWWAGTAWAIVCLLAAGLVFLPPVLRNLHKKSHKPVQNYAAFGNQRM